jgi:selenocysteine lyase/cysteine desulfurase
MLRDGLSATDSLRLLDRGRELCAIVTFTVSGWEPTMFKQSLDAHRINSSLGFREYALFDFADKDVDWCIRLSPHYYNAEQEVEQVLAAIKEITQRETKVDLS